MFKRLKRRREDRKIREGLKEAARKADARLDKPMCVCGHNKGSHLNRIKLCFRCVCNGFYLKG